MKPSEFDWKEDQQVTVINPTKKDFRFKVHSKDYVVGAGQTAKMPGYIAWVYVYKLATQMAQDTNVKRDKNDNLTSDFVHWNEEGFRKKYYDKIVVETDEIVQTFTPEPQIETLDKK